MATERIPLTQPIESRNGSFSKDSYSANVVFETRDQKREFIKRPGLTKFVQVTPVTPPAYKQAQGLFSFSNNLISVIDNTVYKIVPSTKVVSTVGTMSSTTNQTYFTKTLLDTYLFLQNKTNAYLYSSGGTFGGITNDKVVSISIDNTGVDYSEGITLTFSGSGGAAATATVDSYGHISDVTVTAQGSGYVSAPTITIVQPSPVTIGVTADSGSLSLTIPTGTSTGIYKGMTVTGTGIAPNTKVVNVAANTPPTVPAVITIDTATTDAISGDITFTDNGSNGVLTAKLNAFPTGPYVSGVVNLDNYMFIGVANSNRIYNSEIGDPTSWNALSYLTFEQTADNLVGIVKHLNYLVAFGKASTQFYYDAGNPIGSPLALSQSYTNEIGCASGDSIVATNNTVLWIGTSKTYGKSVYLMDGVSPNRVSTANVDRHLEADDLSRVTAYCYTFNGHTLYVLTLHQTNTTLVYDLNEKMWYRWTQYAMASNDQTNPGTYYESYFRPTFYAQVNGVPYCLDDDNANIYTLSTSVYTDNGQHIYCRSITDLSDNGSTKRKFFGRLEIIGDKVPAYLWVSHTGDDYKTWSTPRQIDLNATRSQIYLSGADRRRAWQFLVYDDVALRLDAAEIDFRIGEMDQEQSVGGGRYRR